MNENNLPQWAIDAMKEAGVSAESGWASDSFDGCVIRAIGPGDIYVYWNGRVHFDPSQANLETPEFLPAAFRLAAALENKPDPKVAELERIILACKSGESHVREVCAKAGFQTHHKGGVLPRGLASVVEDIVAERDRLRTALAELHQEGIYNLKVQSALSPDADAKGGEEEKEG